MEVKLWTIQGGVNLIYWWKDPIYDDEEFFTFLKLLVEHGHLDGAALGITKQVISHGLESLSEKQKCVFKKSVIDELTHDYCSLCCKILEWSELHTALDGDGICDYCDHHLMPNITGD